MAVVCGDCDRDMAVALSCSRASISLDGREWPRVRYGDGHIDALAAANGKRCPDCGIMPGGIHHAGCCKETCPACGTQLFCCDCHMDDAAYVDDVDEVEDIAVPFPQAVKMAQEVSRRVQTSQDLWR